MSLPVWHISNLIQFLKPGASVSKTLELRLCISKHNFNFLRILKFSGPIGTEQKN